MLSDLTLFFLCGNSALVNARCKFHRVLGLKQLIAEPTRESILDFIIVLDHEKVSGVISIRLSDHILTFCTRTATKLQVNKHNTVRISSVKV